MRISGEPKRYAGGDRLIARPSERNLTWSTMTMSRRKAVEYSTLINKRRQGCAIDLLNSALTHLPITLGFRFGAGAASNQSSRRFFHHDKTLPMLSRRRCPDAQILVWLNSNNQASEPDWDERRSESNLQVFVICLNPIPLCWPSLSEVCPTSTSVNASPTNEYPVYLHTKGRNKQISGAIPL